MKTEIKNLEINEAGTYVVDRINDRLDNNQHHVLDVNDLQAALELFDNDGQAYSLRFVPDGIHHYGYKGRLIAHKGTPFPECLTIAASVLHWANRLKHLTESANDEPKLLHASDVDATIESFNEYYAYHPQLHKKWREIVLLHLRLIRAFAAHPNTKGKLPDTRLLDMTCWEVLHPYVDEWRGDWHIDLDEHAWFKSGTPIVHEELVPDHVYELHQKTFGDTGLLNL
ncbi:MAG: hypothetical protein ACPGVD_10840 [Flavobacteriales bacterium]